MKNTNTTSNAGIKCPLCSAAVTAMEKAQQDAKDQENLRMHFEFRAKEAESMVESFKCSEKATLENLRLCEDTIRKLHWSNNRLKGLIKNDCLTLLASLEPLNASLNSVIRELKKVRGKQSKKL